MSEGAPRILVVDDAGDMRDLYCMYLRQVGMHTDTATTVADARKTAARGRPDAIVIDVFVVGGTSDEPAQCLKTDDATRGVPIIGLCGTILQPEQAAFASQCDALLIKPCLPEDLAAELRLVLSARLPVLR